MPSTSLATTFNAASANAQANVRSGWQLDGCSERSSYVNSEAIGLYGPLDVRGFRPLIAELFMPASAIEWMDRFDAGEAVEPFGFETFVYSD